MARDMIKRNSLVNWDMTCRKQIYGGMGIIKLDDFNRALISKWLFEYYDPTYDSK